MSEMVKDRNEQKRVEKKMKFQLEYVIKSLFNNWKKFQLENGRKMNLRIGKCKIEVKVQLQMNIKIQL